MRRFFIVPAFVALSVTTLQAQTTIVDPWATSQGTAIGEMLGKFAAAGRARDAKAYASLYAEDAQWINAFGDRRTGRSEIETFYTRLFNHPGERDTKTTMIGSPTLRLVREIGRAHV